MQEAQSRARRLVSWNNSYLNARLKAIRLVTYSSVSPVKKSSLTLCDLVLQRPWATVDQFKQQGVQSFASTAGRSINDYNFISRTVLHELTHAWPNRRKYLHMSWIDDRQANIRSQLLTRKTMVELTNGQISSQSLVMVLR